ncbi:SMI1/KNR4 family protein [Streptomyces sp. SLBN-134]|uniref:SMI1/KNR4 family protein n=1 Tax=Streptomyces sp. SLBN-134 TaxID=2768456 RepID=UPI001154AF03|nr:SMI1/KNR4 family protein [Streptomyces sp. SLBN-134]
MQADIDPDVRLHRPSVKGLYMWVQRILEFTDWEPSAHSVDWDAVERELQIPLPTDYKELCEAFGGGTFCDSVYFLGNIDGPMFNLLVRWQASISVGRDSEPHPAYTPGGNGFMTWASTEWADQYCWLLDAERPDEYCILARGDSDEWCRYEMSTSEFLYRVLADKKFKPFGIAEYNLDPTFQPGRSVHRG